MEIPIARVDPLAQVQDVLGSYLIRVPSIRAGCEKTDRGVCRMPCDVGSVPTPATAGNGNGPGNSVYCADPDDLRAQNQERAGQNVLYVIQP